MAKKSKKKPETKPDAGGGSKAELAKSPVDVAFARGNYAAVRALAKSDPSPHAQELLALTKMDMGQVAAGAIAFLVVTIAALLTLH